LEKKIISVLNENKYRYHVSNTGKVHVSTMFPWYRGDCVHACTFGLKIYTIAMPYINMVYSLYKKKLEDIKGVIRTRKSMKERQYNGQKLPKR